MSKHITKELKDHLAVMNPPFRVRCPSCNGGSSHEPCMTVYEGDNDNILATCHRAACGIDTVCVDGTHSVRRNGPRDAGEIRDRQNRTRADKIMSRLVECDPNTLTRFVYQYSDIARTRFIHFDPELDGWVFVCTDSTDRQTGVVWKTQYSKPNENKTMYYPLVPDTNGMSWYRRAGDPGAVVVVVEDNLSAIALWDCGVTAVALNGTHLNEDRFLELTTRKATGHVKFGPPNTIVLALDADATRSAVNLVRKYGGRADIIVRRLQHDIKDMPNYRVNRIIHSIVNPLSFNIPKKEKA